MYSYVVLEIAVQIVSLKCTDYQQQQENICTWYLSTIRYREMSIFLGVPYLNYKIKKLEIRICIGFLMVLPKN